MCLTTLCSWVLQTSAKHRKRIGKAKPDTGHKFFDFFGNLPKNHYGKFTNLDFSQKFRM